MSKSSQTPQTKYIDYLSEDTPIPGQLWCCISFLSPEGIKNCSVRGLKIRGVFGTRQEADKRADELQKIDSDFHVFVGEMGKWLPWDPEPNDVADQVYQEKELNDLMKGYKENLTKTSKMEHDRKEKMIQDAAKQQQHNQNKTKAKLRKKLEEKKQKEQLSQSSNKTLSVKEQELKEMEEYIKKGEELGKLEKNRITETQNEINDSHNNLETIDAKLAKIQELYEKLNKKD